MSRTELCEIICENYLKLTSVANRIIDVFLTFSSGGHSVEAIVHQTEPILLVGETGVSKTNAIQYLAYQTAHKLVVVNINNQSDVSDLIGAFKPVHLAYVVTPLRAEFEALFNQTFNAAKNEQFLNNISVCFNRGDYNILVKLMLRIVDNVFQKKPDNQKATLDSWRRLQIKLNKQLRNSINISFAFIPGSLVNCIRNGD